MVLICNVNPAASTSPTQPIANTPLPCSTLMNDDIDNLDQDDEMIGPDPDETWLQDIQDVEHWMNIDNL